MSNNQVGFTPKNLNFGEEGQKKLIRGIEKIANAVKSTLGPSGNTVLIESPHHTYGITVTKDGVTVAKAVDLVDPVENLAVRIMKEAAERTSSTAGDGTTTSIVLTEALVKSGIELITDKVNRTEVLREMISSTEEVVEKLRKMSKKVTKRRLLDVATISANNDKVIGKIIADVHDEVGENGIVTVEKSQSSETYYETTNGIKVDRGYTSPLFINNQKRDECVMEDVYVMVSDAEVSNILQVEKVLKPIIQDGKKLLIIAPCSTNVVNTLAANVMKSNLSICNIIPPQFGYRQHELMQDIALSVGATYFSEKTGDDLSIIDFGDLGHCSKVIVSRDSAVILKDSDGGDSEVIDTRVAELWEQHKITAHPEEKEFVLSRIASLTGGIGVVYVGGNTDLEQKELYDRVDDAVCAVRSALVEGILPGGGIALHNVAMSNRIKGEISESKKIADAILGRSLVEPLHQILENAGFCYNDIYDEMEVEISNGYDVKNREYGDVYKMGIIDPVKVTRSALQNAVSVAVTILSTNAIITMARTYEAAE